MTTQHYEILIQAPREHVWRTMLQSPTYDRWTATFCEGSRFEGSWNEGQRIRFFGPDGQGMVAEIAENRPNQFISIRHLGFVANSIEDTESEAVRAWAPAYENYTLLAVPGGTKLVIDLDLFGEFEDFMAEAWPKALARLKALCEGNG